MRQLKPNDPSLCVRIDVASIELKNLQFDRAIGRSHDHRIIHRNLKNQWGAEKKFEAVLATAPMSEVEKSEYCRKHGIYPA